MITLFLRCIWLGQRNEENTFPPYPNYNPSVYRMQYTKLIIYRMQYCTLWRLIYRIRYIIMILSNEGGTPDEADYQDKESGRNNGEPTP